MKSLHKNSWSALLISIFVTGIILLISVYLLDKIIPAAKNIKGIENSNVAYYQGTSAIEQALFSMSKSTPGIEGSASLATSGNKFTYAISASGAVIPKPGTGNSEYDSKHEWNKISYGKPLQLVIRDGIDWGTVKIIFRVPDLNRDGVHSESLSGAISGSGMINWIISGNGRSLFATNEANMVKGGQIDGVTAFTIGTAVGKDLYGSGGTLNEFYTSSVGKFPGNKGLGAPLGSYCVNFVCSLKLSIINPLVLPSGETAPYLEYKITDLTVSTPFQFAVIDAAGQSKGFKRNQSKRVQQLTTNEAIDFTVFQ